MYQQFTWGGKVLFWVITAAIWGAMFTPLIISTGTLFPFQTGKGIAYRVLVEVAAFFYLWLLIIEPSMRPKKSPLFWAMIAFVGALILTTLLGVNPYRSFWGDIERMEGVFGVLHGVLLFIILYSLYKERKDWIRLFKVSLLASFFVAMYALAQVYPIFQFLHVFEARETQPGSTLGNPAFVSTYAVFQIFFALFVLLWEKNRWWQIYGAAFFVLNFIVLGLSAIRGAQVGMVAAAFIGGILALVYLSRSFRTKVVVSGFIVFMIAVPLAARLLKDSPILDKLPFAFQRMSRISLDDPSAKTRLLSLGMSWDAFKDRPLVGWGMENFKVGYNKYFNPEHLTYEQAWFDRAHNKIAEVAVQTGAIGLLSYLALFATGFWGVFNFLRKSEGMSDRLMAIAVCMLGVAYFVQNLFLFDMPMSYVMFFTSLGFVGFIGDITPRSSQKDQQQSQQSQPMQRHRPSNGELSLSQMLILLVGAGGVLFLIFWANWRPYQTASLGRQVMDLQTPNEILDMSKKALSYGGYPSSEVIRVMEDLMIVNGRTRTKEWEGMFQYTKEQAEDFLKKEPKDPRFFIRTGKMYNERAFLEPQYTDEAARVLQSAIALSPTRPDAYYELGVTYLEKKENEKALEMFHKAVSLNEKNSRAHWVLGLAYMTLGNKEEGLASIERAIALNYNWNTESDINNLTQIYVSMNRNDKLVSMYEKLIELNPNAAQYRVTLAIAYANAGMKEQAREQALKAVELDAQYEAGAAEFIDNLFK